VHLGWKFKEKVNVGTIEGSLSISCRKKAESKKWLKYIKQFKNKAKMPHG
jgi:hypothetical protein